MTAHVFRQPPSVEYLGHYCPGGFHPVHLSDAFKDGRYIVAHKLGYGHSLRSGW